MFKFLDLFKRRQVSDRIFQQRYSCFKRILSENDRALEIIAELEHLFYHDKPFTLSYVLTQAESMVGQVCSIVEDLNALSGANYPDLFDSTEKIAGKVFEILRRKTKIDETNLILPLESLSQDSIAEVGGKAANLGEVYNRAHLPVPQGFAITAYACQYFRAIASSQVMSRILSTAYFLSTTSLILPDSFFMLKGFWIKPSQPRFKISEASPSIL